MKTLRSRIAQLIAQDADSPEVNKVVERLMKASLIEFSEKGVPTYGF